MVAYKNDCIRCEKCEQMIPLVFKPKRCFNCDHKISKHVLAKLPKDAKPPFYSDAVYAFYISVISCVAAVVIVMAPLSYLELVPARLGGVLGNSYFGRQCGPVFMS